MRAIVSNVSVHKKITSLRINESRNNKLHVDVCYNKSLELLVCK